MFSSGGALPPLETPIFRDLCNRGLAPVFFFVSGHEVPLLRNLDHLLLDKGIARLFGAFFALSRLGAVLFFLGWQIAIIDDRVESRTRPARADRRPHTGHQRWLARKTGRSTSNRISIGSVLV